PRSDTVDEEPRHHRLEILVSSGRGAEAIVDFEQLSFVLVDPNLVVVLMDRPQRDPDHLLELRPWRIARRDHSVVALPQMRLELNDDLLDDGFLGVEVVVKTPRENACDITDLAHRGLCE